jgi:hypothetical protein
MNAAPSPERRFLFPEFAQLLRICNSKIIEPSRRC